MTDNDFITPQQYGFSKFQSTTTILIELTEYIIEIEEAFITRMLLDFSKAFDCLDHPPLIEKLRTMGIRGNTGKWVTRYLQVQTEVVEVIYKNGHICQIRSNLLIIKRSVPLGSILGPVLFSHKQSS